MAYGRCEFAVKDRDVDFLRFMCDSVVQDIIRIFDTVWDSRCFVRYVDL